MEQKRGISITSTVLQFPYHDHVLNLLDTPGHRDFSEDTYRVLAAADAAVMVLDVAKGIEPQTLKLFEVCRDRGLPLLSFLNKYDRPGRPPLELLDEIEQLIGVIPTPVTWPVGIPGDFRGVIDRRTDRFIRFTRTAGGATEAVEEVVDPARAAEEEGAAWTAAQEELALLDAVGADFDVDSFLDGTTTPVFFGSALTNFGVRLLLDGVVDLAPSPSPREDENGKPRDLDAPVLRVRVQGAGEHGPRASRPHRLRSSGEWQVRARHGRDARTARASRSPRSTRTRCSARSVKRSRRRIPVMSSGWSTRPMYVSATRCGSTNR